MTLRMLSLPAERSHAYVRAFVFLGVGGGGGVICTKRCGNHTHCKAVIP